jgi:hypothetical protein
MTPRLNGRRVGSGTGRRFEQVRVRIQRSAGSMYDEAYDKIGRPSNKSWEIRYRTEQSRALILRVIFNALFDCLKSRAQHHERLAMHARNLYYTPLSPASFAHSSIFPSSSSSGSNAFFASLSASSLNSFGTSSCRPLVGPLTALTQVISSSKSLSLLSSCAT